MARGSRELIRWGILGTGRIAHEFAVGLRSLKGAQLYAIASRDEARARDAKASIGAERAYGSYDALLADRKVDIVYVATPPHVHREHVLQCIAMHKAVVCEKPLACTAAEAGEMVRRAREQRVFLMEGMWMRFIPLVREVLALAASGGLGELSSLEASLSFRGRFAPGHRVLDPQAGGGALLDIGVYPLSLAYQLFGRPATVVGRATFTPSGVDDSTAAILGYERATAMLSCSFRAQGPSDATLVGSRGSIVLHGPMCAPHRATLTTYPEAPELAALPRFDARGSAVASVKGRLKANPWLRVAERHVRTYVLPLLRRNPKQLLRHYAGNGMGYEAEEAMRCVLRGDLESRIMPHAESVGVLETAEAIKRACSGGTVGGAQDPG